MPKKSPPAHVYKYQPVNTRTLSNLKQASIWFSAPADFNDPFDCALRGIDPEQGLPDSELQRVLDQIRRNPGMSAKLQAEMCTADGKPTPKFRESVIRSLQSAIENERKVRREQRGVACFSELRDDIVMWSHYADGHRGFCLEFSTAFMPFSKALQVNYQDNFPTIPAGVLFSDHHAGHDEGTTHQLMQAFVLTKAPCWGYEKEWRTLHIDANKLFTYDYHALTGIYFGAAMPYAQKEIISLILRGAPTQLYEMQQAERGFALTPRTVTYTPFPYQQKSESA